MKAVWLIGALALATNFSACTRQTERGEPARTEAAQPARKEQASLPAERATQHEASSVTGLLSEAEFKRLHQLKQENAPPLRGSKIQIQGDQAYLSLPANLAPPYPAVIVIHEWWGLNEHIMHWADRLSEDGYAALAVDLFQGKVATTPDSAMQYMKGVQPERAKQTLLDAHEFVKKDERVKATRRASLGWCFGGKWSLELALAAPDLDAAVVYYGHVTTDVNRLRKLEAPLLALFANRDQSIPPAMVDRFDAALKQVKADYTLVRYDADHAFANPSGERYDESSAGDAWKNARRFLASHLKPRADQKP